MLSRAQAGLVAVPAYTAAGGEKPNVRHRHVLE